MRLKKLILNLCIAFVAVSVVYADLSFTPDGDGFYSFDTGVIKGKLRADDQSQGIPTFVDKEAGIELAYGKNNPGIFSYYRLFTTNKRWGDTARGWKKTAEVLEDGSVKITWPPHEDHPFQMTAVYRWISPNTLDLETTVTPEIDMPDFEVFLSSYFNNFFKSYVSLKPKQHNPGENLFVPADVNPLVIGTYLAFPRDRESAQIINDGRWKYGPHPVHFSTTRYFAYPLCMKKDESHNITLLIMSRPQDCFAIEMPYNMIPPDGIAAHNSIYLSLFGKNFQAGETAKAITRLVAERDITGNQAVSLYQEFIQQYK